MIKNYVGWWLLVAMMAFGCSSPKQNAAIKPVSTKDDGFTAQLDSLLQTTHPRIFNGVVMITRDGIPLYAKAKGYADLDQKIPLSIKDNFRIQSNSKQITAVLMLKEVEKGTLDLQKTVAAYLPNELPSWADTVTVKQLLNMTAGVASLDKPLAFAPGTGFLYSNAAYGLLGRIYKKVTGQSYREGANRLFASLGMKHTYCYSLSQPNPGLINGYWQSNDSIEKVDFSRMRFTEESWASFLPAGGIISTAEDLIHWDTQLHQGMILQPASYAAMTQSGFNDPDYTFSEKPSNYGFGINMHDEAAVRYLGHAGRGIGFVSLKLYVPLKRVSIVIWENMYNRDNNIVYHFQQQVRRLVMNSQLLK